MKIQASVSFAVMSFLIFAILSLSFTSVTGSSRAGIRYLHLHWIVVRQDIWNTSVSDFFGGLLVALIVASLGLTWVLSGMLKLLHHKKSGRAWLLFGFVVVVYLLIACQQGFAFS